MMSYEEFYTEVADLDQCLHYGDISEAEYIEAYAQLCAAYEG